MPRISRSDRYQNRFSVAGLYQRITMKQKVKRKTRSTLFLSSSQPSEANYILSNARSLRSSNRDYIKSHVYINRDLTKSEAAAAHEYRLKRREKAKQAQVSQPVEMDANVDLQGNDSSESHDVTNLSSSIQTLDNFIPDVSSHSKIPPLVPNQHPACLPTSSHSSSSIPPPNNPGIQVVPIPSVSGQSKLPHQGNK